MIRLLYLLLAGVVLSQNISPAFAQSDVQGDLSKGRVLADLYCARCHNVTDEGASPFQPAPPFRELSSRWPLENLEEALAEGISVGHDAMPEFKLGMDEIDDLMSYIRSINP